MLSILLGGVDARTIGPYGHVGDVEVNWTRATNGGGPNYAKWSMALPRTYWHEKFATGTMVEIFRGDLRIWAGTLTEADRKNWAFVADGLFKRADKFFNPQNQADPPNFAEVIDAAIENGLEWAGIVGTLGEINVDVTNGRSISSMLTAYCEANSARWSIDSNDMLVVDEDPILYDVASVPTWAVTPGTPLMPTSDDSFLTRANILYVGGGTWGQPSTYDMATSDIQGDLSLPGGHEVTITAFPADISGGDALILANRMYRQNSLRFAFTEGLDIWPGELTTPGGTPIDNWAAYTLLGHMGNHHGAINRLNNVAVGQTVQWVMGSVTYRPGENSLRIASVDMDPRDFNGIIARVFASRSLEIPRL